VLFLLYTNKLNRLQIKRRIMRHSHPHSLAFLLSTKLFVQPCQRLSSTANDTTDDRTVDLGSGDGTLRRSSRIDVAWYQLASDIILQFI
jgi:hypothetical protein